MREDLKRVKCLLASDSPLFASKIVRMADIAILIQQAEKQLGDQNISVKPAKEDVTIKEQAWQKAKGKQFAIRKNAWQAAVKREEAEREGERHDCKS